MMTEPTAQITTPRSPRPLFLVIFFTYLCLVLVSVQGCGTSSQQEHKWLFYDLETTNGLVYQGYRKNLHAEDGGTLNDDKLKEILTHPNSLYKPTFDEDDQLHVVIRGPIDKQWWCIFVETDYVAPHDSKLAPTHTSKLITDAKKAVKAKEKEVEASAEKSKKLNIRTNNLEEDAKKLKRQASEAKKKSVKPSNEELMAHSKADIASQKAADAKTESDAAMLLYEAYQEQLNSLKRDLVDIKSVNEEMIVCDLNLSEKGSKRIDYMLMQGDKTALKDIEPKNIILKDTILVHELYRYRILAGPVFSTLQKRNKTYELRPNNAGQSVITAIRAQDHPANFALLLKVYHTKRDTLNPPPLSWNRLHEMINPIIGINLLDKPLQNFYAGISFEPWGGFDIIGGVHWAKTQQLVDGFSQGQATTQSTGLTKERFNNGWFVGVAADIGIITTWLKSAGSGIVTAIKANP